MSLRILTKFGLENFFIEPNNFPQSTGKNGTSIGYENSKPNFPKIQRVSAKEKKSNRRNFNEKSYYKNSSIIEI